MKSQATAVSHKGEINCLPGKIAWVGQTDIERSLARHPCLIPLFINASGERRSRADGGRRSGSGEVGQGGGNPREYLSRNPWTLCLATRDHKL